MSTAVYCTAVPCCVLCTAVYCCVLLSTTVYYSGLLCTAVLLCAVMNCLLCTSVHCFLSVYSVRVQVCLTLATTDSIFFMFGHSVRRRFWASYCPIDCCSAALSCNVLFGRHWAQIFTPLSTSALTVSWLLTLGCDPRDRVSNQVNSSRYTGNICIRISWFRQYSACVFYVLIALCMIWYVRSVILLVRSFQ